MVDVERPIPRRGQQLSALVRWEGYDVSTGEPWEDSWQPVTQGWMSRDQIAKARAMEAAKYGISGSKRGAGGGDSVARATDSGGVAGAVDWRSGKLRARDAGGRVVRVAASDSLDELSAMIASTRAKAADLAAMRARVGAEMAAAMDTGVRVNAALAQALGVEVPARLRSEGEAGGTSADAPCSDMSDASSEVTDESDSEGFGV